MVPALALGPGGSVCVSQGKLGRFACVVNPAMDSSPGCVSIVSWAMGVSAKPRHVLAIEPGRAA